MSPLARSGVQNREEDIRQDQRQQTKTGDLLEEAKGHSASPVAGRRTRRRKDKDHRAIIGYSMGGGHSTSIGFGHPELFAYVGAFSGFGSTNLLTADPAKTNKNYRMIFIGAGTEDTAVNGGRTMHDALTKAGVKHMWSEDAGYGHDYQIWRQYFYRLMQQTFRD
jgi:enterochelin esterase-like enzyme